MATGSISKILNAFESAETIPENTNMNNLITPGCYYSPNSARTSTLANYPLSGAGFSLIVLKQSDYVWQIAWQGQYMVARGQSSGSWQKWKRFTGTEIT